MTVRGPMRCMARPDVEVLRGYPGSPITVPILAIQPMSIAVQQVGLNATVLRVCGEVDLLTAPMLQAEVDKQLMLPRLIVVIDLSGTTFFGVSGVAVLLEIRDRVAHTATSLRLVQRSRAAAKPLELLHLSGLFLTYTHLADTLGA